jgi:hypothetical protein
LKKIELFFLLGGRTLGVGNIIEVPIQLVYCGPEQNTKIVGRKRRDEITLFGIESIEKLSENLVHASIAAPITWNAWLVDG